MLQRMRDGKTKTVLVAGGAGFVGSHLCDALLLRGHNDPGGGFVGGLIAAAAFSLYAIAFGVNRARQALLVRPLTLLGTGLLIALASGLPAVVSRQPFLTASWMPGPVTLGTPVLFDIGVFLVVAGVVLMMIFSLGEES